MKTLSFLPLCADHYKLCMTSLLLVLREIFSYARSAYHGAEKYREARKWVIIL